MIILTGGFSNQGYFQHSCIFDSSDTADMNDEFILHSSVVPFTTPKWRIFTKWHLLFRAETVHVQTMPYCVAFFFFSCVSVVAGILHVFESVSCLHTQSSMHNGNGFSLWLDAS